MNKTILLGSTNAISNNASKWIFSIIGIIYIGLGITDTYEQGSSFSSIGRIIIGISFLLYSLIIFSATPLTPKIKVNNNEVELKNKIFSKTLRIMWMNIKSIEFDSYSIGFRLNDGVEKFNYKSNAESSIEIKSLIRKVAESKNIPVIGG